MGEYNSVFIRHKIYDILDVVKSVMIVFNISRCSSMFSLCMAFVIYCCIDS